MAKDSKYLDAIEPAEMIKHSCSFPKSIIPSAGPTTSSSSTVLKPDCNHISDHFIFSRLSETLVDD